jgi:hypothetical protein
MTFLMSHVTCLNNTRGLSIWLLKKWWNLDVIIGET